MANYYDDLSDYQEVPLPLPPEPRNDVLTEYGNYASAGILVVLLLPALIIAIPFALLGYVVRRIA